MEVEGDEDCKFKKSGGGAVRHSSNLHWGWDERGSETGRKLNSLRKPCPQRCLENKPTGLV